jgi:hypothetical protein
MISRWLGLLAEDAEALKLTPVACFRVFFVKKNFADDLI